MSVTAASPLPPVGTGPLARRRALFTLSGLGIAPPGLLLTDDTAAPGRRRLSTGGWAGVRLRCEGGACVPLQVGTLAVPLAWAPVLACALKATQEQGHPKPEQKPWREQNISDDFKTKGINVAILGTFRALWDFFVFMS